MVGSFLAIARNRQIVTVSCLALVLLGAQTVYMSYLSFYLSQTLLLSVVVAGLCLASGQACGSLSRIVMGLISDRWLKGRRMVGVLILSALGVVMTVVLAFLSPELPFWLIFAVASILGLALTGWNGLYLTYVAEIGGPDQAGRAVGFSLGFGTLGGILAAPIFGYVTDLAGSYRPGWLMVAGSLAIVVVLLPLLIKESPHAVEPRSLLR